MSASDTGAIRASKADEAARATLLKSTRSIVVARPAPVSASAPTARVATAAVEVIRLRVRIVLSPASLDSRGISLLLAKQVALEPMRSQSGDAGFLYAKVPASCGGNPDAREGTVGHTVTCEQNP